MIAAAIIFLLIGVAVKYGKMYFLIAGYNTMSEEEKANYNIEGIASLMFNVMAGMAAILLVGYFLARWLDQPELRAYFLFAAPVLGVPYLLYRANSGKYKKSK